MKLLLVIILLWFTQPAFAQFANLDFNILDELPAEKDSLSLGYLRGVDIDAYDNLYLFDFVQNSVFKLDEEGNFERRVIRNGRGPGEINSIYSFYIDKEADKIIIADRQNARYSVTDLKGDEIDSYPLMPSQANHAMGITKYDNDTLVLLFQNSQRQQMRRTEGIDSLIHFYDSDTFERLYSIVDRTSFAQIAGYESEAAALVNNSLIAEVVFTDEETLLISPYVFNKGIIVYKKTGESNWRYHTTLKSRPWDTAAFEEVDFSDFRQNKASYREKGYNYSSSSSADGNAAGIVKLRSAGIYTLENGNIINFLVQERLRDNSFFHELYAEMYSTDLGYIGSDKIYEGETGNLIMSVSGIDSDQNFYMHMERDRGNSKVLKFSLLPD